MNSNVKRKFNALLQGIGNRPATERSSTDIDRSLVDPASSPTSQHSSSPYPSRTMANDSSLDLHKKRRVGGPASTPTRNSTLQGTPMQSSPASIRSVPQTTTISNVTLRKWTPGGASPAPDGREGLPPPPKYCPGDRDQLLRRLATFQELTDWTPKPDRVSEVEWAKRGWACQGKERVRCTLCARELVVKVNKKEVDGKEIAVLIASEIAESVVDKYVELIVESHAADCLWRKKGCDDALLRLPLPNPKLALQGLRQRYDELCERAAFLPYEFNLRLPPTLNLDTILPHLPATFFTNPPPPPNKANPSTSSPPPINRPALALALLGWQSLTHPFLHHPVPNSASCHTCLRRLGLWMFKSREVDPATDEVLVPAPMDHLDPLREHRFFCPWKHPAAQRNPGARPLAKGERELAAWEVLVLGLKNEAFIRDKVAGSGSGSGSGLGTGKKKSKGMGMGMGLAGHGRSKSSVPASGLSSSGVGGEGGTPKTPERRPITVDGGPRMLVGSGGGAEEEEEEEEVDEEEARKTKDKDMMSRLRRVKSLFNTKAGGKLRRFGSRPGTSHSSVGGEAAT
ncbi:NIPA-like protein [Chaetomidium leptoderma]|uniref:NIPA-like protein n=1 Tax=Chaetomidium leptoderma TaxID=669021 RepID=A0AAN6VQY7_9PEZI|nr:NIPA-like protein [Chaetomidium leptoderma]